MTNVELSFSDSQIRPSVERVLKIWQERKVFDKDVVQKLIAQLYRDKGMFCTTMLCCLDILVHHYLVIF